MLFTSIAKFGSGAALLAAEARLICYSMCLLHCTHDGHPIVHRMHLQQDDDLGKFALPRSVMYKYSLCYGGNSCRAPKVGRQSSDFAQSCCHSCKSSALVLCGPVCALHEVALTLGRNTTTLKKAPHCNTEQFPGFSGILCNASGQSCSSSDQ
eukprot:3659129-Amphidinium_carterae.2